MTQHECDLVVVGSGPGGYVAAIRASQLGLKTICVEKDKLGGVCLNVGCIPSKSLLKNAEYMNFFKNASDFGFNIQKMDVDFSRAIDRSREVADRMSNGVSFLFKKNKVQQVTGHGNVLSRSKVEVRDPKTNAVTDTISCKNVIIATGARTRMFPFIEVDHKHVWTSTDAIFQRENPGSLIVIGAGAIGVELAYFYNAYGTNVTIVEMMPNIVPVEDIDVSKELERNFKKAGMNILTQTRVISAKPTKKGVEVLVEKKDGTQETLVADRALNAVGVQANIEGIGLEQLGVKMERGWIVVDKYLRTNVEGVYAIGDVAGPPWLAHKASAEGIVCAEFIAGHETHGVDYGNIPGCTYCNPQVASVGLTEAKAREAGHEIKVGKFPFTASGKAHGIGKTAGFVKLIFDAKYGELLGAHMIGPDVTEMIAELGLARSLEATGPTLFRTIHAHPTLSEAVMEAAAGAWGEAVNF